MKYIFVMNPGSGKGRHRRQLEDRIRAAAKRSGIDYRIYYTKRSGDGEEFIGQLCRKYAAAGEKLRIYGCGGDGTVNELVNGSFGFENVEIGVIPMGTGNDYVRNYGNVEDFLDIDGQINGSSVRSDLIKYSAEYDGETKEGYCANMFNIGFDCNVVDMTDSVKKLPLIGGSLAYLISVFVILIEKKGADLRIEYDDGRVIDEKILLIAIANGCFCGGGVKGVPYSVLDDGLMDVSVVRNITRRLFLFLFPSYAKGVHMEKKQVKGSNLIEYSKEKTLTVTANGRSMRLCTDGEITTQKRVKFEVVEDAFSFIVPEKNYEKKHEKNHD